jgi:hypothetical protein
MKKTQMIGLGVGLIICLIAFRAESEITSWVDENGIKHYEAGPSTPTETAFEKQNIADAAEQYFKTGLAYFNSEDYSGAVNSFEHVYGLVPNWPENRYYLGLSYLGIGDLHRASLEVQFLSSVNPELSGDLQSRLTQVSNIIKAKQTQQQAEERLKASEKRAEESQQRANESLTRAKEAEEKAKEAERKARRAESEASSAESKARMAEMDAHSSEMNARAAEQRAQQALNDARRKENQSRINNMFNR